MENISSRQIRIMVVSLATTIASFLACILGGAKELELLSSVFGFIAAFSFTISTILAMATIFQIIKQGFKD